MDVLLHHQCVSMVTQCLVMNTRPHNSAQIYVFDLDVISFSNLHFFLSQRNTFYTSVTPTHTLRELSLSFSRSPFLHLPPTGEGSKLDSLQGPLSLWGLMRTNAQMDTHGHIRVHQNIPWTHTSPTHVGRHKVEVGHTLSQGCKTTRQTFRAGIESTSVRVDMV